MPALERQALDDTLSKQWEIVTELFSKRYGLDFQDYFTHNQVILSEENILIISIPAVFIKNRIEEYSNEFLEFWQKINPNIQNIIFKIGRIKEKKLTEVEKSIPTKAEIIQLPLWSEDKRGTPNSALRGSLFSAIHGNQRKILYRKLICDEPNLKIIFTGKQLDQSDLDVWEMVLHMARQQDLGTYIYFTARGFLKSLGRNIGKTDHEWLKDSLERLVESTIKITHDGYTYADNMISFAREEETQRYKLSLNPAISKLFLAGWTGINFEDRQKIGKRPLALWLHGYISSHVKIYPTKTETYHRLSGSNNSCMRDFKRHLKNALEHLKKLKLIQDFSFESDLVNVHNIPTNLQLKHAKRKLLTSIKTLKKTNFNT